MFSLVLVSSSPLHLVRQSFKFIPRMVNLKEHNDFTLVHTGCQQFNCYNKQEEIREINNMKLG